MQEAFEDVDHLGDIVDKAVTPETITGGDTNNALTEVLSREAGIDSEKARQVVQEISDTINALDENYRDLQAHKAKGGSTEDWLTKKIDEAGGTKDKTEQVRQILTGLEAANREQAEELHRDGELEQPLVFEDKQDLGDYISLNKKRYAKAITDAVANNTLLNAIELKRGKLRVTKAGKENPLLKQFFEAPLEGAEDSPTKKAVSIALTIAREKQLLPQTMSDSTNEEIAVIVDQGLSRAKTMYKVGTGELSPVKAIHYVIDRTTSVVGYIAKGICTIAGTVLGRGLGSTVGQAIEKTFNTKGFSKGAEYVGGVVGSKAGETFGGFVQKGCEVIGNAAKKVVTGVAKGIETGWNAVKSGVKSFLGL